LSPWRCRRARTTGARGAAVPSALIPLIAAQTPVLASSQACPRVAASSLGTSLSTDDAVKATATGMLYCQQMGTRSSGVKKLEMSLVDFCQILWSWVQRFWRESPSPQMPIRYVDESGPPIARAFPVQPVRASRPTRELAASRRLNQHGTRQRITADSPRRCERLRLSLYDR
jgi:hypothetical protein